MKTDDLISMLASDAPAIDRSAVLWRIAALLLAGAAISFVVMVMWLEINPELNLMIFNPWFWVRFTFIASASALAWWVLFRLGKPGIARGVKWWWIATPVALIAVIGCMLLVQAPAQDRMPMILGISWDECSRNIAVLSIPIFVVSILIARNFAPTRLRLTGATLGFFSGALAAFIYSMHCPELAPSFLMIWYVLGMAIPAVVGALLGRRLLAW